jgi:hypothetical protein
MSQLYVVVLAVIAIVLLPGAPDRTWQVKTKANYPLAGRSLPALHSRYNSRPVRGRCGSRADKRRIAEWMQTQNSDVRDPRIQETL